VGADEGDKAATLQRGGVKFILHAFDELQFLIFHAADRDHHSAAFGKLREKRSGRRGGGSGYQNRVERRELRQSQGAVTAMSGTRW
jgi:hypothetical protein